jgi:2',3'-cyclic-nucleotide 2'-phosphodiesterase (5'-nucleotidase family)
VDSGDWTMGTLYDLTLGDRPLALYFLELMHYNCVTLGNHEFDYSPKGLAQILDAAQDSFAFRTSSSCFLILELTPPALPGRMWSWPGM